MNTWVLVRGLTREARHWGQFPAMLAARQPGCRIVTLDLPGFGSRRAQTSPARIDAIALACRARLREMAVTTPVHLLAMSLGGMVAIEWARQAPQELAGALLINTSLRRFSPAHHRLRPAQWPALLRLLLAPPPDAAWEAEVLRLTTRHPSAEVLDDWVRWRHESPFTRANALRQIWAASSHRSSANAPPVKLKLLGSLGDALVDPRCTRRIAERWNAPVAWHATAGHDLPLDDPAWVAEQAADFAASSM